MSVFVSLIIILLAMLIQGFLELSPGLFSIFYHHALGKTDAKKADDRALSFILGVEICVAIIFLVTYMIINFFITKNGYFDKIFFWVMSGIFLLEALVTFFFYFRPAKLIKTLDKKSAKNSTELFLPRRLASNLIFHAEQVKSRSSTIALGFISCTLELFFTLPLYIMASYCIFFISPNINYVFIIAYIVIATIPLFTIRTFFRADHNLAEIQQIRVKKKLSTKILLTVSYLLLFAITFITGFSQ